jgi:4-amino-4-deoxy-L-arabinose transferase-like glycosyltransferase
LTEAASLETVKRIQRGEPLYAAPTLQHIPMIYGPVYFYFAAAIASVVGPSYLPLRLVSLVASAGSLTLVAFLVKYETGSRAAGLVGAGLLAMTYPLAETALDLGRVDALFVFFLLAGLTLARTQTSWIALAGSGVCLGLAGLTKLPLGAAPVALAILVYLTLTVRARAIAFASGAIVTVALIVLALRLQSGPWPTWYIWDLPRQHAINDHGDLGARFWFLDILPRLTFPLLIGPVFLLSRALIDDKRPLLFYTPVSISLVGIAWASRTNSGGATNVLLPAHAIIAVFLGLGLHAALHELDRGSTRARALQAYILGVCIVQFALIAYNPRLLVPFRSEQWAAERLSTTLANLRGALLAPDLDGYLLASDKGEQPHMGAAGELMGEYGGRLTAEGQTWRDELAVALREQRYSHVVLSEPCCTVKDALDRNGYVSAGPLFPPDDDYWRWTGSRTPSTLEVFVPARR